MPITMKNWLCNWSFEENVTDDVTPIGFFSHIDTADFNAENIRPQVHRNYDGKRVVLDEKKVFILIRKISGISQLQGRNFDYFRWTYSTWDR